MRWAIVFAFIAKTYRVSLIWFFPGFIFASLCTVAFGMAILDADGQLSPRPIPNFGLKSSLETQLEMRKFVRRSKRLAGRLE